MVKHFNNLLSRNHLTEFDETWLRQLLKPVIFCSNDNPGLTSTYFRARSNFATWAFIWENETKINASCALNCVIYGKLTD